MFTNVSAYIFKTSTNRPLSNSAEVRYKNDALCWAVKTNTQIVGIDIT